MDWEMAIEKHRETLKRLLAALVALAGFGSAEGALGQNRAQAEVTNPPPAPTLPRHLYRAVLRLLRPAEAAVRRLIIVFALTAPQPAQAPSRKRPARKPKPKITPTILRRGVGTGIILPPGVELPGLTRQTRARRPAFPLLDPLRTPSRRRKWVRQTAIPRISVPGLPRAVIAPRPLPSPNDPMNAARVGLRLQALAAAL